MGSDVKEKMRVKNLLPLLLFQITKIFASLVFKLVLRSRNYLFSAPAPPLSIISAPAPAPCMLQPYNAT